MKSYRLAHFRPWHLLLMVFVVQACSGKDSSHSQDGSVDNNLSGTLAPVETRAKVAPNQEPAFKGQTRIAGIRTKTVIKISTITTGLNHPWGLAFMPDGRMIVSERPGTIRIVTTAGSPGTPIKGVPAVRNQGEGGLLDLKVAPDFANSRLVFWAYVEPGTGTGVNCVASGKLSSDESAFENVRVIYRGTTPYSSPNHNGSRMQFDSKGLLYVSFGERFDDNIRVQAQQLNSSLGKIIRINQDGSAPAGNPFANIAADRSEIWSYGHRNPQGLAINPVNGELWETEHGPQGGDELNIIKPGSNYGWPIISYGLEYGGQPVNGTGLTKQDGMEQPVYYWDPAIAPSGMIFYTGSLIPEWKNNLFIGALAGRHIIRLVINNDTHRVIGEERLLAGEKQRIRLVVQGPDGALYAITDEDPGRIYRIGI